MKLENKILSVAKYLNKYNHMKEYRMILKLSSKVSSKHAKGLNYDSKKSDGLDLFNKKEVDEIHNIKLEDWQGKRLNKQERILIEMGAFLNQGVRNISMIMDFAVNTGIASEPGSLTKYIKDNYDIEFDISNLQSIKSIWQKLDIDQQEWHVRSKIQINDESYQTNNVEFDFGDGWKVLYLPTNEEGPNYKGDSMLSHDRTVEGNKMGTCLGGLKLYQNNDSGKIYSVRDPKNKPQVTIRISDKPIYPDSIQYEAKRTLEEAKGPSNCSPFPAGAAYAKKWFEMQKDLDYKDNDDYQNFPPITIEDAESSLLTDYKVKKIEAWNPDTHSFEIKGIDYSSIKQGDASEDAIGNAPKIFKNKWASSWYKKGSSLIDEYIDHHVKAMSPLVFLSGLGKRRKELVEPVVEFWAKKYIEYADVGLDELYDTEPDDSSNVFFNQRQIYNLKKYEDHDSWKIYRKNSTVKRACELLSEKDYKSFLRLKVYRSHPEFVKNVETKLSKIDGLKLVNSSENKAHIYFPRLIKSRIENPADWKLTEEEKDLPEARYLFDFFQASDLHKYPINEMRGVLDILKPKDIFYYLYGRQDVMPDSGVHDVYGDFISYKDDVMKYTKKLVQAGLGSRILNRILNSTNLLKMFLGHLSDVFLSILGDKGTFNNEKAKDKYFINLLTKILTYEPNFLSIVREHIGDKKYYSYILKSIDSGFSMLNFYENKLREGKESIGSWERESMVELRQFKEAIGNSVKGGEMMLLGLYGAIREDSQAHMRAMEEGNSYEFGDFSTNLNFNGRFGNIINMYKDIRPLFSYHVDYIIKNNLVDEVNSLFLSTFPWSPYFTHDSNIFEIFPKEANKIIKYIIDKDVPGFKDYVSKGCIDYYKSHGMDTLKKDFPPCYSIANFYHENIDIANIIEDNVRGDSHGRLLAEGVLTDTKSTINSWKVDLINNISLNKEHYSNYLGDEIAKDIDEIYYSSDIKNKIINAYIQKYKEIGGIPWPDSGYTDTLYESLYQFLDREKRLVGEELPKEKGLSEKTFSEDDS